MGRSDLYDIVATLPEGADMGRALAPALQALLIDRFQLTVHTETREMPIYELVLARRDRMLGSKLKPSAVDCTESVTAPVRRQGVDGEERCVVMGSPGRNAMAGLPISRLARMLTGIVGRPVTDKTGLTGTWSLELEFTPEQPLNIPVDALPPGVTLPSADAPSVFTALQEQLGLKLESTNGLVDVMVIDRVEKPTTD